MRSVNRCGNFRSFITTSAQFPLNVHYPPNQPPFLPTGCLRCTHPINPVTYHLLIHFYIWRQSLEVVFVASACFAFCWGTYTCTVTPHVLMVYDGIIRTFTNYNKQDRKNKVWIGLNWLRIWPQPFEACTDPGYKSSAKSSWPDVSCQTLPRVRGITSNLGSDLSTFHLHACHILGITRMTGQPWPAKYIVCPETSLFDRWGRSFWQVSAPCSGSTASETRAFLASLLKTARLNLRWGPHKTQQIIRLVCNSLPSYASTKRVETGNFPSLFYNLTLISPS